MRLFRMAALAACGWLVLTWPHQTASAQDQSDDPCANVVSEAQGAYVNADYEQVVGVLAPCVHRPEMEGESSIEAYRLLSLSYLKLDDISSARTALIRLLSDNPTYRADPVSDLPSYRALVDLLRRQLGLETRATSLAGADTLDAGAAGPFTGDPDGRMPPAHATDSVETRREAIDEGMYVEIVPEDDDALRELDRQAYYYSILPFGHLLITTSAGASAYGGERGADGESIFGEFGRNAGPRMELLVEYGLTPSLLVGLAYSASEYPHISANKWTDGPYRELSETSSDWVHALSLEMRGRLRATDWLYPYAAYGVVTTYHFMNGSFAAGVGPMLGAGVDFQVNPMFAIFLEFDGAMIFPGTALDLADHEKSFDPLTTLSAGVRFRTFRLLR